MSQENVCLLCITENAKYDKEFLAQRAFFSAPKLQELRLKWNEAIIKIHPVLEDFVNNVNTYKICDLHFKESDIKKCISEKSSQQNICTLPLWNWVLKIKALPLSAKELENEKNQIFNTTEKSRENLNRLETNVVDQDHSYISKSLLQPENNNEYAKMTNSFKENKKAKEKSIQPIKHDHKNVKFAPYSINSDKRGESNQLSQILQLEPEKNRVLLVATEPNTISVYSPVTPVSSTNISSTSNSSSSPSSSSSSSLISSQNCVSSPKIYPIITNVTSLAQKTPKFVSLRKITSPALNYQSKMIPILPKSKLNIPLTVKSKSVQSIPSIGKKLITLANSQLPREPIISIEENSMNNTIQLKQKIIEPIQNVKTTLTMSDGVYTFLKLMDDLKQKPLPRGWAYQLMDENKLLFTQYCIKRKFPIFLLVDKDLTTTISVGYEAVKFIQHKITLNLFADVCKGLRKMESFKWCLGIGFDQNNHSDMCLILCRTFNSRCHVCLKIRRNAQRRESNEITKQRKQSKDLRPLLNKLRGINKRLDTKVCKLKLMVNHLKKKQCVECLHNKFLEKNSIPVESESLSTTT
ncbi:uncharacterized protein LOC122511476 [Leptopilina heterotoma]|uniref:uncharacterized protein LOC122511476 n=1 Tax=Leptopilina heterotoma TaxID=63436 RepID=UPI001CA95529|nr:uncharacterized protein LOC122511476 [Leptopilina heterotoma]